MYSAASSRLHLLCNSNFSCHSLTRVGKRSCLILLLTQLSTTDCSSQNELFFALMLFLLSSRHRPGMILQHMARASLRRDTNKLLTAKYLGQIREDLVRWERAKTFRCLNIRKENWCSNGAQNRGLRIRASIIWHLVSILSTHMVSHVILASVN